MEEMHPEPTKWEALRVQNRLPIIEIAKIRGIRHVSVTR